LDYSSWEKRKRFLRRRNRGIMWLVFILAAVFAVAGTSNSVSAHRSLIARTTDTVQINTINPPNPLQYGSCYPYNCNYNPNSCQPSGYDNTTQCAGYLYQDPVGCIEIVIPIYSPAGLLAYQYYTLHNLPASYPPIGAWVIVTGQLRQGHNVAPNEAACPGNYINVTSISQ